LQAPSESTFMGPQGPEAAGSAQEPPKRDGRLWMRWAPAGVALVAVEAVVTVPAALG
jgi:hypothetical protein